MTITHTAPVTASKGISRGKVVRASGALAEGERIRQVTRQGGNTQIELIYEISERTSKTDSRCVWPTESSINPR